VSLIPDDVIEQVRDAADIVGIIGEQVELKRSGGDYEEGDVPLLRLS